jgi:hypothetical protein
MATSCSGTGGLAQEVRMSAPGPNGTTVPIITSWFVSASDTDPGPGAVYEMKLHLKDAARSPYVLRFAGPRISPDGPGGSPVGDDYTVTPPYAYWGENGIGDIDHRAVGQAGAEIVNATTGAVLCAGTGDPSDLFYVDNFWVPLYAMHMRFSLHCDDPGDASPDLTLAATGRLDAGGYGAI